MKEIKYFEDYCITTKGDVINNRGKTLKPYKSKSGYLNVYIYNYNGKKGFRVNRLVAFAFIPNPLNKPQVNHLDGDKLNNKVNNLEWCTGAENMQHAHKMGLMNPLKGKDNNRSKPIKCRHPNGVETTHDNSRFLCKELDLHRGCVLMCLNGKRKHHKNYTFQYV